MSSCLATITVSQYSRSRQNLMVACGFHGLAPSEARAAQFHAGFIAPSIRAELASL
jgi:hypothetical protein